LHKKDSVYNPRDLSECLVSPAEPEEIFYKAIDDLEVPTGERRQYSKNFNFVRRVGKNSIALIPSPRDGIVYAGYTTTFFEKIDKLGSLYEEYVDLRRSQELYGSEGEVDSIDLCHASDIAQVWRVDSFRKLPIPEVPAWIRASLFSRSTYAIIWEKFEGLNPYEALHEIIDLADQGKHGHVKLKQTTDVDEIHRRIARTMTPQNFEHLVISLLQLENPTERWFQVGGSGDGGMDGLGYSDDGKFVGRVQCKLILYGDIASMASPDFDVQSGFRQYVATLLHSNNLKPDDGVELLDGRKIADLVLKHAAYLPEAFTLRVGV